MSTSDTIIATSDRYLMPTYARSPVAFVRGEGARLWDADGREYLEAFCELRGADRVFAIGNIEDAREVSDEEEPAGARS